MRAERVGEVAIPVLGCESFKLELGGHYPSCRDIQWFVLIDIGDQLYKTTRDGTSELH